MNDTLKKHKVDFFEEDLQENLEQLSNRITKLNSIKQNIEV